MSGELDKTRIPTYRLEFVTDETEPSLKTISERSGFPLKVLKEIAQEEDWEGQKRAFKSHQISEVQEKTKAVKVKASLESLKRGEQLQSKIFDALLEDIENGNYRPTISDFNRITDTIENIGKETISNIGMIGNNNKIINIKIEKPIEDMSLEELVEIQGKISVEDSQ